MNEKEFIYVSEIYKSDFSLKKTTIEKFYVDKFKDMLSKNNYVETLLSTGVIGIYYGTSIFIFGLTRKLVQGYIQGFLDSHTLLGSNSRTSSILHTMN